MRTPNSPKRLPELQRPQPESQIRKPEDRDPSIALIGNISAAKLGLKDGKVALEILQQAAGIQASSASDDVIKCFMSAFGMLTELGPSGGLETTLAVQMMGVHKAALVFLRNATVEGQTPEGCDANVRRAAALLRLFTQQIEAMQSLKGKTGQQKVVVEHVHVHRGGQAIVGAVNAGTTPDEAAYEGKEDDINSSERKPEHPAGITQERQ